MAYTPNTWKSGDVVTSAKLNNIENGIADGGVTIVNATTEDDVTTLDRTWQEIYDATIAFLKDSNGFIGTINAFEDSGTYIASCDSVEYTTDSANGYPSAEAPK